MTNTTEQLHAKARMDREIQRQNEETLASTTCIHCGSDVPSHDYKWKFAAAGGVLAGPFCGRSCQFGWLNE